MKWRGKKYFPEKIISLKDGSGIDSNLTTKLRNVKYVFMLFPVKKGLVMKNIVFLVSYCFDG